MKTTKVARGVMKSQGMVSALFHNRGHVLEAYQALIERGYNASEVMLLMSPETRHSDFGTALDFSPGGNGFFDHPTSTAPAHDSIKEVTSTESMTAAGISPDRALVYTNDIASGAIVVAVMPKGPTDRYTIGQFWRKGHGQNILGDDEDF
jgi:hypothetical protein